MENWFHPGCPEEAHLIHYHALNRGSSFLLPWPSPASFHVHGFPASSMSVKGISDNRAAAASNSHSQAEKRRRERINAHLSTLRRLIPRSDKMDKAALLSSVVDHVKDLKRKAVEIGQVFTIPTEFDEITVEYDEQVDPTTTTTTTTTSTSTTSTNDNNNKKKKESLFIKASVCCNDRPELYSDLMGALKGFKLRTVRAEIGSLGGRVKNVLIFCSKDSDESVCLNSLRQSLKVVLNRATAASSSTSGVSSKRQRLLLPSHY